MGSDRFRRLAGELGQRDVDLSAGLDEAREAAQVLQKLLLALIRQVSER